MLQALEAQLKVGYMHLECHFKADSWMSHIDTSGVLIKAVQPSFIVVILT
jgi:hypothetical protein